MTNSESLLKQKLNDYYSVQYPNAIYYIRDGENNNSIILRLKDLTYDVVNIFQSCSYDFDSRYTSPIITWGKFLDIRLVEVSEN